MKSRNEQISFSLNEENFPMSTDDLVYFSNGYLTPGAELHTSRYFQIFYVVQGSAFGIYDDDVIPIKTGDLIIINPNTMRVARHEEENYFKNPFIYYALCFTPEFLGIRTDIPSASEAANNSYALYTFFNNYLKDTPYLRLSGSELSSAGEIFNKAYFEYKSKKKGYVEMIRNYIIQLLITGFRSVDSSSKSHIEQKNSHIVNYICEYIKKNYSTHLSVQDLADMVYLNRDYLGRIFRKHTGKTISEMIQEIRIERACAMLINTTRTNGDIAAACGFDDMKFFYKVFKKQMGVLPKEYRKHHAVRYKNEGDIR